MVKLSTPNFCVDVWLWCANWSGTLTKAVPTLDFKTLPLLMPLWQVKSQVRSKALPNAGVSEAPIATDNILLSENPLDHVDFVLGVLKDENNNARALGYLVTRALIGKLSGQHQLSVAQRAIQAMGVETLSGMEDFMKGSEDLQSVRCSLFRLPPALIRS